MEANSHRKTNGLPGRVVAEGPLPILVSDAKGNIEYVNARFTELTGYKLEEVLGKNPRILSAGKTPESVYQELWDTILSGRVWKGDLLNKGKNGDCFWETISICPLKNDEGVITHFVGIWQDTTARKHREENLERQSITDDLTGLYNRRHILEELEKEMERALRYNRHLAGLMIDIDNFKVINDRYGHLIGDRVLKTFAGILKASIRKIDIVGRYGGDEFFVMLPESTVEIARTVVERIRSILRTYEWNVASELAPLTASFGLLSFADLKHAAKHSFVERVDRMLLEAKRAGKDKIVTGENRA